MIRKIYLLLGMLGLIFTACSTVAEPELPTQISVPTATETPLPTVTPFPTDEPLPAAEDIIIPRTDADTPAQQAYLRVINASTQLGSIDFYVEYLAVATNLDYGRYTERGGIVAGTYNLRILRSGSLPSDPTLFEQEITIVGGQSIIFLIAGTPEAINLTTILESNDPLPRETSRTMMINAVSDSTNMVMLVNDVPQTAVTPYLQISEVTQIESGNTDFVFQDNGNEIATARFDIRERQNYTLVIFGEIARPETINAVALTSQAPGLTSISIVNGSPSVGIVDVYFSGILIESDAFFGEISVPQEILSGTYDISVYPTDTNPDEVEPIAGTQFIANPDEDVVLVIVGEPNSLRFVVYRNDPTPTFDDQARITFINALETLPSITLNTTRDFSLRLNYAAVSDTFIFETIPISFAWIRQVQDGQDVSFEEYSNFVPVAGTNYLYIFAGRGVEDPILLTFDVGTIGIPASVDVPPTVAPSRPTRIRVVNVWEGRQFEVRIDTNIIAEAIEYSKATNPLIMAPGPHTVSIYEPRFGDETIPEEFVWEVSQQFDVARDYTIVIYNGEQDLMMVLDDTDILVGSASAAMRLVVLDANQDSLFGLGFSQPTTEISQPDASEGYRRSLSVGVQQIIRNTPFLSASQAQRLPIGLHNIRIIDNETTSVAYTHIEYNIEGGVLYDVFLTENSETRETKSVIIPYPSP